MSWRWEKPSNNESSGTTRVQDKNAYAVYLNGVSNIHWAAFWIGVFSWIIVERLIAEGVLK